MKIARTWKLLGAMAALGLLAVPAQAQTVPEDSDVGEVTGNANTADNDPGTVGEGKKSENLPEPKSDNDPQPQVPAPSLPTSGIIKQAGVGGAVSYGRRGVLELGGSAGLTAATDFTQVSVAPSLGWFLMDNLEISAIMGLNYAKTGGSSRTLFTGLVEPSFHIPFNKTVFGFVGLGAGIGYVEGPGAGFALAPRLGANFLVGRSGVLTPAAFLQYTTHEATQTPQGTLLAVSTSVGMQVGYTVMW